MGWFSSFVMCLVMGVSEFLGLNCFFVGWFRWDVIMMVVLVFSVILMVGNEVWMWVFFVILFVLFSGMLRLVWMKMCWLVILLVVIRLEKWMMFMVRCRGGVEKL